VAAIAVIATALAVLYPSFGVTLIVVLIAEGVLSARKLDRVQSSESD
jgi:uncharacterized iron-regulated membrane protein